MNRMRILIILGVLVLAVVLAFAMQDVIRESVVVPLAYFWWVLGIYYSAFPQMVLWICLVVVVLLMLFGSLERNGGPQGQVEDATKPVKGPVEELAVSLEKAHGGIYLKWQIAHRLGKLARDLLVQRGDRVSNKVIAPLAGRDWHPSRPVEEYLEAGLNGSFADYPTPRWPFGRPQPTPLDLDVNTTVEFLEGQMETNGRY